MYILCIFVCTFLFVRLFPSATALIFKLVFEKHRQTVQLFSTIAFANIGGGFCKCRQCAVYTVLLPGLGTVMQRRMGRKLPYKLEFGQPFTHFYSFFWLTRLYSCLTTWVTHFPKLSNSPNRSFLSILLWINYCSTTITETVTNMHHYLTELLEFLN